MPRDRRLDLIAAFMEAGLVDKAEELKREMLAGQLGQKPRDFTEVKVKLDEIQANLDSTMDKIADKLGLPRRKRRRPK